MLLDKLTKSILDPIHGLIRMTKEEMDIISHPLFNRLRKIKQNTFLYYVFPSSIHTRFEHSLGVMHLASQMFQNAFYNMSTLNYKQNKYDDINFKNKVIDYHDIDDLESLFYDLRIAALLHDIGHGPMSHLFDKFAIKTEDFLKLLNEDKNESNQEIYRAIATLLRNETGRVKHEIVSLLLSYHLLKELDFDMTRIKRIITIMENRLNLVCEYLYTNDQEYDLMPFLNQIVAGAPLDCDRMDYLLRDSYFSGAKYGIYDLNRLLNSILPYIDADKKIIRLGIKKSGLPAIENFLNARYELYVQLYFHKTNCACNSMLEKATNSLKQSDYEVINSDTMESFIMSYLNLSDENFLDKLKGDVENKIEEKIISDLKSRNLWKRLIEFFPDDSSKERENMRKKLELIQEQILNENPDLEPHITVDYIKFEPLKNLNNAKTALLEKDVNENYKPINKDWENITPRLRALNIPYVVGRVYINADQVEKSKFREIKKEIHHKEF